MVWDLGLTCMCMYHNLSLVRTTVEIPDDLRARLLEIAARRGLKGFSALVEEALVLYLGELERREQLASRAMALIGTLSEEEAEALESSVSRARRSWR
jgi:metal-responsive CopG/Arc/MetJ family transcriptional regulator